MTLIAPQRRASTMRPPASSGSSSSATPLRRPGLLHPRPAMRARPAHRAANRTDHRRQPTTTTIQRRPDRRSSKPKVIVDVAMPSTSPAAQPTRRLLAERATQPERPRCCRAAAAQPGLLFPRGVSSVGGTGSSQPAGRRGPRSAVPTTFAPFSCHQWSASPNAKPVRAQLRSRRSPKVPDSTRRTRPAAIHACRSMTTLTSSGPRTRASDQLVNGTRLVSRRASQALSAFARATAACP